MIRPLHAGAPPRCPGCGNAGFVMTPSGKDACGRCAAAAEAEWVALRRPVFPLDDRIPRPAHWPASVAA